MNRTYNQSIDTLRIEFLGHPFVSQEHDSIIIQRHPPTETLQPLKFPNKSKSILQEAMLKTSLDRPTRSEEVIEKYNKKG